MFYVIKLIFNASYSIGQLISVVAIYLFELLMKICRDTGELIKIICQDYSLFLAEINTAVNQFFNIIIDGCLTTFRFIESVGETIGKAGNVGLLKVSDVQSIVELKLNHLVMSMKSGIILLGDSAFFIATLLPKLAYSIYVLLREVSITISSQIVDLVVHSVSSVCNSSQKIVHVILDVPLKSAIGLLFIYLAIKYKYRLLRLFLHLTTKVYQAIRFLCQKFQLRTRRLPRGSARTTGIQPRPSIRPKNSPQKNSQDVVDLGSCVICQDRRRDTIIIPCGHLCVVGLQL